jgi:hypothetical protein
VLGRAASGVVRHGAGRPHVGYMGRAARMCGRLGLPQPRTLLWNVGVSFRSAKHMAVIGSNARGSVDRLLSLTLQGIHYVPRAERVPATCDYSHVMLAP